MFFAPGTGIGGAVEGNPAADVAYCEAMLVVAGAGQRIGGEQSQHLIAEGIGFPKPDDPAQLPLFRSADHAPGVQRRMDEAEVAGAHGVAKAVHDARFGGRDEWGQGTGLFDAVGPAGV